MVAMALLFMLLLLLLGVSAPVESRADATAARASGASRRVLPRGMCEPGVQSVCRPANDGRPPRVHRPKGGRTANGSSIWLHAKNVGLSVHLPPRLPPRAVTRPN